MNGLEKQSESHTFQRKIQTDENRAANVESVHYSKENNQIPAGGLGSAILQILVSVLMGIVMGICLDKGRVIDPINIRSQMALERLVMIKVFLSAIASGLFSVCMLAMIPFTRCYFNEASRSFYDDLTECGLSSSIIGGLILGVGMALSGSCPTMSFAQLGAGVPNAVYVIGGAFIGTILYTFFKRKIESVIVSEKTVSINPNENSPFFMMSLPLVAMLAIIVFSLDILIPWYIDIKFKPGSTVKPWIELKAWPPYVCGAFIGLLQLPCIMFNRQTLGGSSALNTLLAAITNRIYEDRYLSKFKSGLQNWWKIFYLIGIVSGAYYSTQMSGRMKRVKGASPLLAISGGALMFFGARIAGGCTTGHGLSGMALLCILSFLAVGSMFSGGMLTLFIMRFTGTDELL